MMGIMVAICKIIEKDRDNIMRVLNFYIQEINFHFKRFLPCLCKAVHILPVWIYNSDLSYKYYMVTLNRCVSLGLNVVLNYLVVSLKRMYLVELKITLTRSKFFTLIY